MDRTLRRIDALRLEGGVAQNLSQVLRELLPLDEERRVECRVYVAFAARAASDPSLAAIQKETQAQLLDGLTETLLRARADGLADGLNPPLDPPVDARLLLAVADGLVFDAVSEPDRLPPDQLTGLLERYLARLLPTGQAPSPGSHAR
ncbi:hypothetical protein SBI_00879 [Streptomyces bingchenggensis BCW-1]|uniref:BetI-type transcriptional repressor C-terminal domain-containing protein n=1 Tax=Streptomyces bingchenggensis (strain BCW-1) TaxID=749414 RepID=D7C612_STRBB|nr:MULTISPECIES: TetR family transcriptional regulator C-terminal domain-containing protein [Streptomyces]ADI04000.1 hypothetical protein SBI_00879 [Streptomyces bingchenggensis BCW-1]